MTKRKTAEEHVYKIIFTNQGQVYELYARHVSQGDLFGFIEVEQLLFGERSKLIVDSSEERLKTSSPASSESSSRCTRWCASDEVEKQGAPRISPSEALSGVVKAFPVPTVPPGKGPSR